jgi:membrane-associated phospholipid phosphatase
MKLPVEQVTEQFDKLKMGLFEPVKVSSTHVDVFLKWLPSASSVALAACNVKTDNSIKDQLKIFAISETVLNAMVIPLKHLTKEVRPNGSPDMRSFPSGHTATSFLGAEMLRRELKENYPVAAWSGYAVAATTGILRVLKNKHWIGDVVAGAALGILAVKISYWLHKKEAEKLNQVTYFPNA